MCNTIEDIKQLKDPFIWFASDGSVMAADGGVPIEFFNDSMNWMKVWLDRVRDLGYSVEGWRVYSNGSTYLVAIENGETVVKKI